MLKSQIAKYIRLSLEDDNDGESNSVLNQRDLLDNYINKKSEFNNCEIFEFCDDGYTGTNMNRPGLIQLIEKAKNKEINCIIVKDFSRFGRDYISVGMYLEMIFPVFDVRFIAINDGFDSNNYIGDTGGLQLAFKHIRNTFYSRDLSNKVMSSKLSAMRQGKTTNGQILYGYKVSSKDKHKYEVDEIAADVVKKVFDMFLVGKELGEIAAYLNDNEIPSPKEYKKLFGDGRSCHSIDENTFWTRISIGNMLRNECYTGKMISGKTKKAAVGSKKNILLPKSEWIIVPGTHEAIINEKVFEQVQSMLSKNSGLKSPSKEHIFARILKCGGCTRTMKRKNSSKPYFYCSTKQVVSDYECVQQHYTETELQKVIFDIVQHHIKSICDIDEMICKMDGDIKEITDLEKLLQKVTNNRNLLYEKFVLGEINEEQFISEKQGLSQNIKHLKMQISSLKKQLGNGLPKDKSFIEDAKKFEGIKELNHTVVNTLIKEILLYDDKRIKIIWNHQDEYEEMINET